MYTEKFLKVIKPFFSWIIFLITFYIIMAVVTRLWGEWHSWYWESIIPILAVSIGSLTLLYILKKYL